MTIDNQELQQGDELILTHPNRTRETVWFVKDGDPNVAATTGSPVSMSDCVTMAIVKLSNGTEIMRPLSALSRPE